MTILFIISIVLSFIVYKLVISSNSRNSENQLLSDIIENQDKHLSHLSNQIIDLENNLQQIKEKYFSLLRTSAYHLYNDTIINYAQHEQIVFAIQNFLSGIDIIKEKSIEDVNAVFSFLNIPSQLPTNENEALQILIN